MSVFGDYAATYDFFYEEKDYTAECKYLENLWKQFSPFKVSRVLDLGCGTGRHSVLLSQAGYQVVGIDRSDAMLDHARSRAERHNAAVSFLKADVTSYSLGQDFDSILAMFAVMGYQNTLVDLLDMLECVYAHLKPGGLFICDLWYGPAVLSQQPEQRVKLVEKDGKRIERFANPEIDLTTQTVAVNYHVRVTNGKCIENDCRETHLMRFFFDHELKLMMKSAGLELVQILPFMATDGVPTVKDWNVVVVAQRPRVLK